MKKQSLLKKAMRILDKYGTWWDGWNDARGHVLDGNLTAAKANLIKPTISSTG